MTGKRRKVRRMTANSQPETDLARLVAAWLMAEGWEVYPEVQLGYGSPRADLVALRRDIAVSWVICCKMSLGFAVIEQAAYWLADANWVSVAVPRPKTVRYKHIGPRIGWVAKRCLRNEGIGLICADAQGNIDERISPRLNRRALNRLHRGCRPEHQQMGVAGSKHHFYTPFQVTRLAAERFVGDHPQCTIKELVAGLDHHWSTDSTARACVLKYIARGVFGSINIIPGTRPFKLITNGEGS